MAISKTSDLFDLIKAMTKAEKRIFRVYAERIQDSKDLIYMQVFDILVKQKALDEDELKRKMGNIQATKFSNAKRHLHEQILTTIRMSEKSKNMEIKIREYLDFAAILYDKGLYMQALKIIDKAKRLALKNNQDFTSLIIIETEKMIHSRHITRSQDEPIQQLVKDSNFLIDSLSSRVKLSNLRIAMHKFYIENGHIQNQEQAERIQSFFSENMPTIALLTLSHMEKVHLYQSYVWYYYILNDFENCFIYAKKWVELFHPEVHTDALDINLYLRAYHYVLTCLYNLKRLKDYTTYYQDFEEYRKLQYSKFNKNTQILSFLYVHMARLNYYFLQGHFSEGVTEIPRTLRRLKKYESILDHHKVQILQYKIAWMYLGNNNQAKAIKNLQLIISKYENSLRWDIQVYARIMFLMCHYDLDNLDLLPSLIRNYEHFFTKEDHQTAFQQVCIKFFKEINTVTLDQRKHVILKYIQSLEMLESSVYEKRAFLYLDILTWLKAKSQRMRLDEYMKINPVA